MTETPSLAVFGAVPKFRSTVQVGQFHWPEWDLYEKAARGIFDRRYYTAQRFAGPLVVQFQQRLQEFLNIKHAIVVRNATNGLMIATHSLRLRGKVIVPSWTSIATVQSLLWSNCQPVFCDIDPISQQMSLASTRRLLDEGGVKGILGVHLWGDAPNVFKLETLAEEYRAALYFDAAHAFGCWLGDTSIATFGRASVFSFHASNILSTAEGGCIVTNDDNLAAEFKAMRGDHVVGMKVSVQSATARMSEMQAAIGLALLDEFDCYRQHNEEQHSLYQARLSSIPGVTVLRPETVSRSNFQQLVCVIDAGEFGLTRDELIAVLQKENVAATKGFYPLTHAVAPFANAPADQLNNTERAGLTTLQLPLGALVTVDHVERICDIIAAAHAYADLIRAGLGRGR